MASDVPSVHDQIARGLKNHPAKKGMRFNVLVTLVEIGGSIALFHLAQRLGASDVVSYLVGSIGPVVGGLAIWAKARKFSGASASIFAFTAVLTRCDERVITAARVIWHGADRDSLS
jgi:hypothetical protein